MDELRAINFVHLALALTIAIVGMFFHYYKMWLRGQTKASLGSYLFGKKAIKSTINATLVVFGTIITMFVANMIDIRTIGGLVAIFTLGYTGDSMMNRDSSDNDTPT